MTPISITLKAFHRFCPHPRRPHRLPLASLADSGRLDPHGRSGYSAFRGKCAADKSLDDLPRRLRSRFLGKHGIHALGVRQSQNALCIYIHPHDNADHDTALKEIEKEAAPFNVVMIREEPPSLT